MVVQIFMCNSQKNICPQIIRPVFIVIGDRLLPIVAEKLQLLDLCNETTAVLFMCGFILNYTGYSVIKNIHIKIKIYTLLLL